LADYLFLQIGLAFGVDFSPANWEAIRCAQAALAERLFFDMSLIVKHHAVLDKIRWCRSLSGSRRPRFVKAIRDALNPRELDDTGTPVPTPHGVYVDDDIYLDVADPRRFEQAIAASIEAIFILLGASNTSRRQDPISWDKLHELLAAPVNRILGLVLDLRRLTVGIPPEFTSATVTLLRSTWGRHRRSFRVKEAKELMGRLNHIAFGAPWLRYFLGTVYASLAAALRLNNSHLIRTSQRFLAALREICTAPASVAGDAKRTFYTGKIARSIHGCDQPHFIDRDLRHDLRLIEMALSDQQCPKSCPIALLIPRVPSRTARSDSSLNAARGVLPQGSLLVVPRVAFAHPDPHPTTCKVASRPLSHQYKCSGVCLTANHHARLSPSLP
jgi:hypothetical protein